MFGRTRKDPCGCCGLMVGAEGGVGAEAEVWYALF